MNLLLVDALNLIRRVYAAQPGEDGPERVEGARTSCAQSLRRGLDECAPTHAACVFEGEGRSWRHALYDAYKAGHRPMPEALHAALDSYRETFSELGVESVSIPQLEADDVIATVTAKAAAAGIRVTILSVCPLLNSTRNCAFGSASVTIPSCFIGCCLAIQCARIALWFYLRGSAWHPASAMIRF